MRADGHAGCERVNGKAVTLAANGGHHAREYSASVPLNIRDDAIGSKGVCNA